MSSNLVMLVTLAAIDDKSEEPIAAARTLADGLNNTEVSDSVKCRIVSALDHWPTINRWWHFLADDLPTLELLAERGDFAERKRAALLSSKILHCLNDPENALRFALNAAELFSLTPTQCPVEILQQDVMYVQKMTERAIDDYRLAQETGAAGDAQLAQLIDRIIQSEFDSKHYAQVIDMAVLMRRLDYMTTALTQSGDPKLLAATIDRVMSGVRERKLCEQALTQLVLLMDTCPQPSYEQWLKALVRLDRPQDVSNIIRKVLNQEGHEAACQLALDLYQTADQHFVGIVSTALQKAGASAAAPESAAPGPDTENDASITEDDDGGNDALLRILQGQETTQHMSQFLIKSNKTDMLLLKQCKDAVRSSVTHNGTVLANGLMHTGTTCDDFLRDNLEWVSKATNWNKFNAVASLGLIHKGHETDFRKLLEQYLPQPDNLDSFGYKEGGALYALGLIYANHGSADVIKYLREHTAAQNGTGANLSVNIRHGACLGLGLAAMGTHDMELYNVLNECLHLDDAVTGEAAAMAIGHVMLASRDEHVFQELMSYAVETTHDKIKRGLSVGMALLMYGHQEQAEPLITRLSEHDSEVTLRQTAVLGLAMAYAGTGIASVVGRLLSRVANDPNDDVKRFAAMAIGFVMLNHPAQCVEYCAMLTEHFNGCIRYGAAMAVAISNAGTANKEAIALIEPLLSAKESFVRQGAVMAMSMLLIQHNAQSVPKVTEFRDKLTKIITEKGEENMVKFGAIVAQGLIDAGGRNVTISLRSRTGAGNECAADMCSVAGMLCFMQYWFWHSMVPMISLTFTPTCIIALNADLKMPELSFNCAVPASKFAYPPATEEKKDKTAEKVETVQLSMAKKKKKEGAVAPTTTASTDTKDKEEKDKDKETDSAMDTTDDTTVTAPAPEPATHTLTNPARVLPQQLRHMQLPADSRYAAVKALSAGGLIMLKDTQPDQQQKIVAETPAGGMTSRTATQELTTPPSAFSFNVADYRP